MITLNFTKAMWRKNRVLNHALMAISVLAFVVIFANSAYADTYTTRVIKKSEITRIATFPLSGTSLQGNTITKDYFVISDLNNKGDNSTGKLVVINRTNCEKEKTIEASSSYRLHMSGLYNEWGSNYVYMVNNAFESESGRDGCYDLSTGKKVKKSKCPARPTYVEIPELDKKYYTTSARGVWQGQGSTFKHNGYYFRIIWEHHKSNESRTSSYIYVFKNRTTVLQRYKLPSSITPECTTKFESEDISVDGDTGDVYVGYNCSKNRAIIYKINSSVFGNYTKGKNDKSRKVAVCDGYGKVKKMIEVGNISSKSSGSSAKSTSSGSSASSSPSDPNTSSSSDPVSQDHDKGNCVKTVILGENNEYCDDGNGSSIKNVLGLIVEIMTIGIGVLGVLGITITGVQYLTAGDNEEKTKKAKRRVFEIIIGLAVYIIIYVLLKWLLPGLG